MLFFKKKKAAEANRQDYDLVEVNAKTVEVLIAQTEDENFRTALRDLQEELKYLMPSAKSKVYDCDKKIKNLLEDLKIALIKCKDETANEKAQGLLKDIHIAIAERKTVE